MASTPEGVFKLHVQEECCVRQDGGSFVGAQKPCGDREPQEEESREGRTAGQAAIAPTSSAPCWGPAFALVPHQHIATPPSQTGDGAPPAQTIPRWLPSCLCPSEVHRRKEHNASRRAWRLEEESKVVRGLRLCPNLSFNNAQTHLCIYAFRAFNNTQLLVPV